MGPKDNSKSETAFLKERLKQLEAELEKRDVEIQQKEEMITDALQNHVHFDSFKKLKELSDEKVDRLNQILRHGVKITESPISGKILASYMNSAFELLNIDKAAVFLKKTIRKKSVLKIVAGKGISPEAINKFRLKIGEGLAGWAFANNLADLIYDASRDERFIIRKGHKPRRETVLVVPIKVDETVIGVMCAEKAMKKRELFTRNDLDFLIILTNFAAGAFKNARIYQKLQLRLEETFTLMEISEAITSTLKLDEVLNLILANLSKIIGVQRCSIMLLNNERKSLTMRASLGLKKIDRSRTISMGEGIAGWVAKKGEPLLIQDIDKHPFYKRTKNEKYISKSLLSVPIRYKDTVIGVLNITNKKDQKAFTEVEQKLVSYYADQVSIAIENANLYSQVERMAITDALTGLANHRYFQDILKNSFSFAKESNMSLSMIMSDVDDFKKLNDTYGHLTGDQVLSQIGSIMLNNLQEKEFFASRYGGEEFAIILPGINENAAFDVAETLRKIIHDLKIEADNETISISISCGVAMIQKDINTQQKLIDHADKAMYHAKRTGKNKTIRYSSLT